MLLETNKKAKTMGIEFRVRLFSKENLCSSNKIKNAEKENIQKMIKLESKVNAQIESNKECSGESCPPTPDSTEPLEKSQENLCVELLVMLKMRMDLAYAEIISRIGGRQALTVLTNAAENAMKPSPSTAALQNSLLTPDELSTQPKLTKSTEAIPKNDSFSIIDEAPDTHRYYSSKFEAKDLQKFLNALQKEYKLLKESLPPGVWVRAYDNRTDLLSVMIRGPANTPYEDGLFLFDIQLSHDYPRSPPSVHYISYISEALNPNLYVEGKVCVSLLGTWMGRGSEVWGPNSTLLQLIVSIQGLILVAEPYYNEAGYERQTHTQQGYENSRTYNEYVILKLVQSMTELLNASPKVFESEVLQHFDANGEKMCERLMKYCEEEPLKPEFPLLPVSRGLKLSLASALQGFRHALKKALSGRVKENGTIL
jgi:ubiquitin-conjugating enzyme E2 O